jgi:hypothetical protein
MPSTPQPGFFNLWSALTPPLKAGQFRLDAQVDLDPGTAPTSMPVETGQTFFTVDAPRFALPADQLLSTYPPANGNGAYSERLPQVVLKRRTLPWERAPGTGADAPLPWLALVVIAQGEGTLSPEVDVAQCVTPGVTLAGAADVTQGAYLEVTKTVIDAVFPTKEDLPLLCHVRQVDLSDTELALGDDDGWMAVVLANRLPWPASADPTTTGGPDQPAAAPVQYLACLINLEGQLAALPDAAEDEVETFVPVDAIAHFDVYADVFADPDTLAMAQPAGGLPQAGPAVRPAVVTRSTLSDTWATAPAAAAAPTALGIDAGRAVRELMGRPWRTPVGVLTTERAYRFPVLTHWQFTVDGDPSFEGIMQALDVALLGSLPEPDPQAPPPPRPVPDVAATGHVGLAHLTRRGDHATAWYRSPLAPRPTERDAAAAGPLPVAHASDQLRRVTPDGREDLTYAAAFEIGRLLALSQPSVVAALMRWRAEQFGAARAAELAAQTVAGTSLLGAPPAITDVIDLGRLVGGALLGRIDADPAATVGPRRPAADPGAPIAGLTGDLEAVVATGLGLDLDAVRAQAAQVGAVDALAATAVPLADAAAGPVLGGPDLAALRSAAEAAAGGLAAQAAAGAAPLADAGGSASARARAQPDALDSLLTELEP